MRLRRLRAAAATSIAVMVGLLGHVPGALAADDLALTGPFSGSETVYDSSSYTTEPAEITDCPPGTTGGRSGWTRFDAPVNGRLTVMLVSDYDAILHLYTAPSATPPVIATLQDVGCSDDDHAPGGGTEARSLALRRGESAYIQTLGVCPAPCRAPGAQTAAGMTAVRVTFSADDADRDVVPDSVDACPTTAGTQPDGCPAPDRDEDGVPDANDACPTVGGDLANGCPSQLDGDVRGVWRVNRLLTQLVSLVVEAPVGSRINLRCSGRRGVCPFGRRIIQTTTRRVVNLTRFFGRRRTFPSNTSFVVRVTRPRQIGIHEHLRTRRGRRLPRVTRSCIYPGGQVRRCR